MSIDYFDIESLKRWFNDSGDSTHRLNYNLDDKSIVFDIGGFEGDWAEKILDRYGSRIFIFEPVKKYYEFLSNKFDKNKNVKIYNFAVSNVNCESYITINDASSSIFINGPKKEKIISKNINDVINEIMVNNIDIMKVNIEGAEYDLMESISDQNLNIIDNIQIQFHKIGPNHEIRREKIRERLSKTHKITYDYKFVWENWKKI